MEEKNLQIEQFNKIKSDSLLIVEQVKDLTIKGLDDKKGYEAVRAGKMRLVKQRTFITEERKNITRVFDKLKKDVMTMEDDLLKIMEPTEKILAERQKAIDDEKERLNRLKTLPERKELISKIELEINDEFILLMSDAQFQEFYNIKKDEYLTEKENELKAEQEKQRIQKEENERESQRLIDVENARKEEAEKAKIQAEIDKINAEKEKEIALKKAEADKQIAIENEKRKAEAEKQKLINEQNRKEAERLKKIEDDKKADEDKLKKEKEEAEKLEKKNKYINFLKINGYTEKNKDDYKAEWNGNTVILWKKVGILKV